MKQLKKLKRQKSTLDSSGIKYGHGGCYWACEAYCYSICMDRWDYYSNWDAAHHFVSGDFPI